jgi:hypothetical protein
MDWRWIGLQFGLPIVAPIFLSSLIAFLWLTLNPSFNPDFTVIFDITPWSLVFYSLALIGAAFLARPNGTIRHMRGWLVSWLVVIAIADIVYYALMIISRHGNGFVTPGGAYYVSGLLVLASVALCYRAR